MSAVLLVALPVAAAILCALPLARRRARWLVAASALACTGVALTSALELGSLATALVSVGALVFAASAAATTHVGDARARVGLLALCLAATNGALVAGNLLVFFGCWEVLLVMLTILASAGARRADAVTRFAAPVAALDALMLAAFVSIAAVRGSADVVVLAQRPLGPDAQLLPLLLTLPALAVRLGVFPLHTPSAALHAGAPDGVRAVLVPALALPAASAVVRVGTTLFPDALALLAPALVALAAAGAAYLGALAARRGEPRSLGAALTLAQQNVAAFGLFVSTPASIAGAVLVLAALAPAVGAFVLATRTLARGARGALATAALAPLVAVPGSGAFAGVVLTLGSAYARYPVAASLATATLGLGALGALALVRDRLHGPTAAPAGTVARLEWLLIAPLLAVTLVLGVAPAVVTERLVAPAPATTR